MKYEWEIAVGNVHEGINEVEAPSRDEAWAKILSEVSRLEYPIQRDDGTEWYCRQWTVKEIDIHDYVDRRPQIQGVEYPKMKIEIHFREAGMEDRLLSQTGDSWAEYRYFGLYPDQDDPRLSSMMDDANVEG